MAISIPKSSVITRYDWSVRVQSGSCTVNEADAALRHPFVRNGKTAAVALWEVLRC
ncbi:hypothetical protein [Salinibacterium sp. M195]|uniref:hypothetical protein n=1 Tax=Salinibacterium sp. M195 TaxID=2583374 RepID=UPI001C634731|nr:hypothetical protein [Salinibacterium sp. M195]